MNNVLDAVQGLPDEYRGKIAVHCIPGDSERLAKALDAALKCFSDLHKRSGQGMTQQQKSIGSALERVRSELAVELLNLDGFDLGAAKARGRAEADHSKEK